MNNPEGTLDPSEVTGNFGTGETGCERIIRIALDLYGAIFRLHNNQRTGIRAIHGTGSALACYFFVPFIHQNIASSVNQKSSFIPGKLSSRDN